MRIRRVYFTSHPVNSKKLPPEYKAFAAIQEDTANENKVNNFDADLGLGNPRDIGSLGSL